VRKRRVVAAGLLFGRRDAILCCRACPRGKLMEARGSHGVLGGRGSCWMAPPLSEWSGLNGPVFSISLSGKRSGEQTQLYRTRRKTATLYVCVVNHAYQRFGARGPSQ